VHNHYEPVSIPNWIHVHGMSMSSVWQRALLCQERSLQGCCTWRKVRTVQATIKGYVQTRMFHCLTRIAWLTGRKTQRPRLGMYASICRTISYNQLGVTMLNDFKILNGNQIANRNWQEENCYWTHHVAKSVRLKPHSRFCFLRSQ
jgi:hypothetical protein